MLIPSLKKGIHEALKSPKLVEIEAKFNVLHAIYLILLSNPQFDDDLLLKGQSVFKSLLSAYFKENKHVCAK